jgi:hypothetical protein
MCAMRALQNSMKSKGNLTLIGGLIILLRIPPPPEPDATKIPLFGLLHLSGCNTPK